MTKINHVCTHFQITPAAVTDIQFIKPKRVSKRGEPCTPDPLQPPQKKQARVDTGPHHHPQIPKDDLYNSLYKLVPNACLFTIVPEPHQLVDSSNGQKLPGMATSTNHRNDLSPNPTIAACSQASHSASQQVVPSHPSSIHCLSDSPSTSQQADYGSQNDCNIPPPPLTNLFCEEFQALSGQILLEKAKVVFQGLTISKNESELIEMATRNQRESTEWYRQREGRLTASSFHDVLVRKKQSDPAALVKKLLIQKDFSSIPAIRWGIDSEDVARQEYIKEMTASHQKYQCTLAGLVVNPLYPHLGASPDGFTQCQCCGQGLLEIKCPYSGKDCHPSDLKGKKGFFLNKQGLIQSHKYYTQVQGQLFICEKEFCDFVVWTPRGMFIQRIYLDSAFTERLIKKLTTFYVEQLLPELMTHQLQGTQSAEVKVYCFCQKGEHGKMIQCDSPTCKYVWFHFSCIGLKRSPKGSWYCQECQR